MRKSWMFGLLLGMAVTLGLPSGMSAIAAEDHKHDHDHGAGIEKVTIEGELVDSLCYVAMDAKGKGHKQCAIDCAKAGIPVSIVENKTGKLYTVLPKEDKKGLPDSVIGKMGDKVTLKGDLYEKGGNRYVVVESVE